MKYCIVIKLCAFIIGVSLIFHIGGPKSPVQSDLKHTSPMGTIFLVPNWEKAYFRTNS